MDMVAVVVVAELDRALLLWLCCLFSSSLSVLLSVVKKKKYKKVFALVGFAVHGRQAIASYGDYCVGYLMNGSLFNFGSSHASDKWGVCCSRNA